MPTLLQSRRSIKSPLYSIYSFISLPGANDVYTIAKHFNIEPAAVANIHEFLLKTGLLDRTKSGYKIGKAQTHIGAGSPFISKHHINW